MFLIFSRSVPAGTSILTDSPGRLPTSALPTGEVLDIRPATGSSSGHGLWPGVCGHPKYAADSQGPDGPGAMPVAGQLHILVVNHTSDVALLLKLAIQDAFPEAVVVAASDRAEAERGLRAGPVDAVVLAVDDSVADARRLAAAVRMAAPSAKLILMGNQPELPQLAVEFGASASLRRPPHQAELIATLHRVLEAKEGAGTIREEVAPPDEASRTRRPLC